MAATVRRAQSEDIGAMAALLGELFAIEEDFTPDPVKQEKGLALLLSDESKAAFVAADGELVVGMATAQLLVSTAEGGLSALVEDVVVAAGRRQTGIGALLLAGIEEWAKGKGATRLTLVADKDNTPARLFYEKAGWKQANLAVLMKKTNAGANACPGVRKAR